MTSDLTTPEPGTARPFRFALTINRMPDSLDDWRDSVLMAERLGYSQVLLGDHVGEPRYASIPAMAAAASYSQTLRFGTVVFNNDLRHPVMLAKDVATLDVMTNGRYQLGIGAGWMTGDYEHTGLPKASGGVRLARLAECLTILKGLFATGPVTFEGEHYQIRDLEGWPKPLQSPRPPIFVGGGGPRILTLAAHEADIVGLQPIHHGGTRGGGDELSPGKLAERSLLVREESRGRPPLELHMLIHGVAVTDGDVEAAAAELAPRFGLTPGQALESPYLLIGAADQVVEKVRHLRSEYGVSYFSVRYVDAEMLAPVVRALAGS